MVGRSFSQATYRALASRGEPKLPDCSVPRPGGLLVWVHLGHPSDAAAMSDVCERLVTQRRDTHVLLTHPDVPAAEWRALAEGERRFVRPAPEEHPGAVTAFLDHWHPDLGLWVWGGLRPNLLFAAAERALPVHLVAADGPGFDSRRERWLPDLARRLVRGFRTVTARNTAAAQRLARLGRARDEIKIAPAPQPSGKVLPSDTADLDELAQHLRGRPVWFAANTLDAEWTAILAAHRVALRQSHRLLLVIEPHRPDAVAGLVAEITAQGLDHAVWGAGHWPEDATQVLVADLPDERGLWYRIATVSMLGSSIVPGAGGTEPLAAASLGTAILYGPNVRDHLASYSRLAGVGAARIVNDAASLGIAVGRLIAPDQAASMAQAGWEVVSAGADVVDRLLELVNDSLDGTAPQARRPRP